MSTTIATLPIEVLIEVFQSFLKVVVPFDDRPRFTLAAVCPHWRKVMFGTPILWQDLYIDADSVVPRPLTASTPANPEEIFVRTVTAFRCAGKIPLHVHIDLPDKPTPSFNKKHTNMLAPFLGHAASHIATLKITGEAWEMHLSILQGLLNQKMPLLRSFTHCVWFADEPVFGINEFAHPRRPLVPILQYPNGDVFTDLETVNEWGRTLYPKLEHIVINGAPYNFRFLPTTGLRELALSNQPSGACPHPEHIRKMLSFSADTLEALIIPGFLQYEKEDDDVIPVPHPITLPNVKKLSFGYQDPVEVVDFLPWIRTPALKRLEIADTVTPFFPDVRAALHPTDAMLLALMRYLPIPQLQQLEVQHVAFKDQIETPPLDDLLLAGKISPRDMPVTLRFLAALTSLRHLELWLADSHERILSLINYPRAPNFGRDGKALHDGAKEVPGRYFAHLPALECLDVYADDKPVHQFIVDRARTIVQDRPLQFEVFGTVEGTLEEVLESLTARLAERVDDE